METSDLPRVLVAALAVLLTAGCSTTVPGAPMTAPSGAATPALPPAIPATPTPAQPPWPPEGSCQVTATSNGSISSSGASSSAWTINGQTSLSCGGGPRVTIAAIDDTGVMFTVGGATVTIAPGATGRVGGYEIGVTRVAGGTAEFHMLPP